MTVEVDTIVAVATGPAGALSVVRVSGPGAFQILSQLCGSERPEPVTRVATLRTLMDPVDGTAIDRAVVVRYEGPASYTGEDLVELTCHGGWLVPALVVEACQTLGARQAEAGEFTRRAYLNGKLDLVQAEAVADLVDARSRARHRAAVVQLERGLSRRVADLRERVVHLEAQLAHHLDFPEEDDAPVPLERIAAEARELTASMAALVATAPEGELLREGAVAVLAGAPNSGKSSLFNALIGHERAIVTAEPGTTRDALEAVVQLGGFPFRLVDTAGVREARDAVERLGVEVALQRLAEAHVVLLCVDAEGSAPDPSFLEMVRAVPLVLVRSKADLNGRRSVALPPPDWCVEQVDTSVVTGEGLDALRSLLPRLVFSGMVSAGSEQPVLMRRRQARSMTMALEEVRAFEEALYSGVPPEVATAHLRQAESALEELVGLVSVDDVLGAVFSQFCVGK
jgi:tRNA modification GTPase